MTLIIVIVSILSVGNFLRVSFHETKAEVKNRGLELTNEIRGALYKKVAICGAIVLIANLTVALMAKTKLTSVIGIVLACVYFLVLFFYIHKEWTKAFIRAFGYFAVPMAIAIMNCRVTLAGNNFNHPFRTVKSFALFLVIPLLMTLIAAVLRLLVVDGWLVLPDFSERFVRPRNRSEDDGDDEYEDISSDSRTRGTTSNWVYVLCATIVIATIIICATIILK